MKFLVLLAIIAICQAVTLPKKIARAIPLPLIGVSLFSKREDIINACRKYNAQGPATVAIAANEHSSTTPPPFQAMFLLDVSLRQACSLAVNRL